MKFTVGWLKDYLEFDCSVTDLCNKLTDIGLEVEKVLDPSENLKNFKIAKILKKNPHPNADKLSLCEVFDGNKNLQIVCGANNVRENLITVLAPVGTIIFSGEKNEFKIGNSKIRGEESNGMLCSEEELGLSNFSEGIIELDESYKIGDKYSQYINDEDIMIEVAITPNRVDCAGVYGIARDLFAADFGKLKKKNIPKILEGKKFILAIGRLSIQKNFQLLLNFFKLESKEDPNLHLVIAGEGEQRKDIENYININNLNNKVILLGYEKNIHNLFKKCYCYILTSLWEDPGFVIIEAAANNASIISSDCSSGPKEILSNGKGGILFKSGSVDSLKENYLKFKRLNEKEIYLQKVCSKKVSSNYTKFRHFKKLNSFFNEA